MICVDVIFFSEREDFIPPKDPNRLHVVKRLRDQSVPSRHLGDGEGLEEVTQTVVSIPGVELETVVTDGTGNNATFVNSMALK